MNYKPIIIIALIIIVSIVALTQALHIYEEGNITLEEHDHEGHDHDDHSENESEHTENETHNHEEEHHEHETK